MKRLKWISLFAAGMTALVLVVGAVGYRSVFAQTTTPETPSDTSGSAPYGPRGLRGGVTNQDLADALGIDLADLEAAQQQAWQAALNQAVEQGLITQAQADQLLNDGRGFGHIRGLSKNSGIDYDALLADALGISTGALSAARQAALATAVNRAVEAGTITQERADLIIGQSALYANEQFQTSMNSAFEAAVKQAVTSGVITQAQADQILAQRDSKGLFGRGGFGMPGMGGRHHGPRGGMELGSGDDI